MLHDFFKFALKILAENGISVESVVKSFIEHKGLKSNHARDIYDHVRELGVDLVQPAAVEEKKVADSVEVVAPETK